LSETGGPGQTRPHGIGIVGTGVIAATHAAAIAAVPGARLIAVTDAVPERAVQFAGGRGCAAEPGLYAPLARDDIDVVRAMSIMYVRCASDLDTRAKHRVRARTLAAQLIATCFTVVALGELLQVQQLPPGHDQVADGQPGNYPRPATLLVAGHCRRASCARLVVMKSMANFMLSWQQAALLALGLAVAGVLLGNVGRVAWAWRWGEHVGPFLREAGVVVGLYALWQLAGNLATGGYQAAIAHGRWIWDTERTLRLPSEVDVQRLLLPHPLLCEIANLYYATMHFGILIATLIWLFARHRDGYPGVRNAMAASTAICLLVSFIPVAPPRLLPGAGIVDLAARYGESVYAAVGSAAGADQLSAMPSVHVAWSVIVAWAVITRTRSRWRWLILLHPLITVFVVVATGNHFWADGIVAVTIDAAVISLENLLARRLRAARVSRQASEPAASPAAPSRQSGSNLDQPAGRAAGASGSLSRAFSTISLSAGYETARQVFALTSRP
jgi:hypothetical protein